MNREDRDINIMIVEADKHPYMAAIPREDGFLREVVGGDATLLKVADNIGIVYDEEGYLRGREPNRILFEKDGEPVDILCGTFAVVGMKEGNISSLTIEQARQCFSNFYEPTFFGINYDREVTYYEYQRKYCENAFGGIEKEAGREDSERERMERDWSGERDFWR